MTALRSRLLALGAPLAAAALVATLVPATGADAATTPVLGSSAYMAPYGEGWALPTRATSSTAATRAATPTTCGGSTGARRPRLPAA